MLLCLLYLIFTTNVSSLENVANSTALYPGKDNHQPNLCAEDIGAAFERLHREKGEGGGGAEKRPGREGTGWQAQRKAQREQDSKAMRAFNKEREGWKHSRDKEHSCLESWGLLSGLGIDLSCSLWKVMSRSSLQCVLRSLECELSCLLLDSLFTKLGGPILIFYSDSFATHAVELPKINSSLNCSLSSGGKSSICGRNSVKSLNLNLMCLPSS